MSNIRTALAETYKCRMTERERETCSIAWQRQQHLTCMHGCPTYSRLSLKISYDCRAHGEVCRESTIQVNC